MVIIFLAGPSPNKKVYSAMVEASGAQPRSDEFVRPSHGRPEGWISRLTAEHFALAFGVIGGFIVFSGQGYYNALFAAFALKPGIIDISQAELISKGVECTFFALFTVLADNWRMWLTCGVIGLGQDSLVIARR